MDSYTQSFYAVWGEVNAAYGGYAKSLGLNDADIWLYYSLYADSAGCTQRDICRMSALPKQTVGSAVARAQKAGHVAFSPNPKDARSKIVKLTDAGRAYAEPFVVRLQEAEEQAVQRFSEADLEVAIAVLSEVAARVGALGDEVGARA
jgi:DNA-binding MarR family transcriptional regulator